MPLSRRAAWRAAALLVAAGASLHCGARSELKVPPPLPPEPECNINSDCPGFDDPCAPSTCVLTSRYVGELPELPPGVPLPPKVCVVLDERDCDDGDPCTADSCDSETGECVYGPATLDLDEDGHNAPLPGTVAGTPEACGDDCNDASAEAFPGNPEVCDGVDNDCNGVVDDDASFEPLGAGPVRVSGDIAPAGPGGIGFNGDDYLSVYSGTSGGFAMYATRLDPEGNKLDPIEERIALQNADSSGGPIVWIGDRYGLAWEDRRDGNYEAYFTLLDGQGAKVIADTRLSFSPGFSVNVGLAWTGNEFVVVWQDDRSGFFEVMAQRISVDGVPQGDNVLLSGPAGFEDESPWVAAGDQSVALAYTNGTAGVQEVRFATFDQTTLSPQSSVLTLSDGLGEAVFPRVFWNEDHYVVTWFERTAPTKAIYGARVSESGEVLTPATALSAPGNFRSRYPFMLPLGDRILLIYADDRDQNQGYELYSRLIASDLQPLSTEQRLTNAAFDSIFPVATFGPEGNVGILFRDDRDNGEHHVWFTQLGCIAGTPNPG